MSPDEGFEIRMPGCKVLSLVVDVAMGLRFKTKCQWLLSNF